MFQKTDSNAAHHYYHHCIRNVQRQLLFYFNLRNILQGDLLEFCRGRQSTESKRLHNPTTLLLQMLPISLFSWRSIQLRFRSCSNRTHRSKLLTLYFHVLSPLPNKTTKYYLFYHKSFTITKADPNAIPETKNVIFIIFRP